MRVLFSILLFYSCVSLSAQSSALQPAIDTIFSATALGYDKAVSIHKPVSFGANNDRTYPIIILFDRQNAINYSFALHTIDYLMNFGQIPECIIVGIEAGENARRYYETQLKENSDDALGAENETFIFEQLLPVLRHDYRGGEQIIIIGHSRFGFYTSYLLTKRISELTAVVSLSPFYRQSETDLVEPIVDILSQQDNRPTNFYYVPMVGDTVEDTDQFFDFTNAVKSTALPPNVKLHYQSLPVADHITVPGLSIGQALYFIFEEYSYQQKIFHRYKGDDLAAAHQLCQQAIIEAYGSELPFSLGYYNGTGWRFFNDKQYPQAATSWEQLMKYYPDFSYGWCFLSDVYRLLGEPEKAAEVMSKGEASLKGNPSLSPEEVDEVREMLEERKGQ